MGIEKKEPTWEDAEDIMTDEQKMQSKKREEEYYREIDEKIERLEKDKEYELIKEIAPDVKIKIKYSADYVHGSEVKGKKGRGIQNTIESIELLDKEGNITESLIDAWRYE